MLEIKGLSFSYEAWHTSYDLSVPAGSCLALLGPSGAGKSTLISLIAGFGQPTGGGLSFAGEDLLPLAPHDRPVTTIFQEHNLFPHLSVEDNVALGVDPSLRLTKEKHQALEEALDRVGLSGMAKRKPTELSGGERRRVALARALLRDKPLMLLDEPFSALDPALRYDMLDLVDEIRREKGLTVILVSHAPGEARRIADQAAFVFDGKISAFGPTGPLLDRPPVKELASYLGRR